MKRPHRQPCTCKACLAAFGQTVKAGWDLPIRTRGKKRADAADAAQLTLPLTEPKQRKEP